MDTTNKQVRLNLMVELSERKSEPLKETIKNIPFGWSLLKRQKQIDPVRNKEK